MPEKKGTVAKVRVKSDVLIKGEKKDMYFVTLEDSQMEYSGIGTCPWKKGETAEFAYIVNEEAEGKTFLNITSILNVPADSLKKASELTQDAKIDRLIQAIGGAKISVSIDKTISERAYEPKKYSVYITVPIATTELAKIAWDLHELMNLAEVELATRVNGKVSKQPEKPPEPSKPSEPKSFQESMDISVPGQKSLVPKIEPESPPTKTCDVCEGVMVKTRFKLGPGIPTEDVWQCKACGERESV